MKPVKIYTMDYCPYCVRAKQLLNTRGISYQEEKVDTDDEEKWKELEKVSGMKTMPQIFIGEKCIGGFTDLDALDRGGKLMDLLK